MPRFVLFGRDLPPARSSSTRPDWQQADPAKIGQALSRALGKPSGGWAVLDASRRISQAPRAFRVAGLELVAWRGPDGAHVAPDTCPHLGASLACGRIDAEGRIVCPWHGLALSRKHGSWREHVAHDDGVLVWVRLPQLLAPGEAPTDTPILPERPARFVEGTIRMEACCEPRDVLANRLDPWHGAHFHPHSFLRLSVLDESDSQITVRVVYKVLGPLAIEVDARFDCPDPRTIVMTIVAGDGVGSVVETHATPIDGEHTAVVEATLATSDRSAFPMVARLQRLLRPMIESRARRLWVEDRAYAERRFALRHAETAEPARSSRALRLVDR